MVLSIEQIKNLIEPIAKKYRLRAVYVFGSYARGEATPNSDIDLLIDRKGSCINSMFDMGNLYNELCDKCKKEIDIVDDFYSVLHELGHSKDNKNGNSVLTRTINKSILIT